jgi:hypothetical protein
LSTLPSGWRVSGERNNADGAHENEAFKKSNEERTREEEALIEALQLILNDLDQANKQNAIILKEMKRSEKRFAGIRKSWLKKGGQV